MAPPVVYVAAVAGVVVTFAAVLAFKEFVYNPHIAPKVDAWKEVAAEHRRQRRARNRGPVAVPVASDSALNQRSSRRSSREDTSGRDSSSGSSVELQDLRSEATGWQNTGMDNNLRHRSVRASTVLDESNVFVPYDPISPTPLSNASTASSPAPSESITLPSSPIIHSPLPTTAINASRLQQYVSARSLEASPRVTSPRSRSSPMVPRSPSPTNTDLASSMSTTSSFTPVVVGPASSPRYGTPSEGSVASDTVRSVTLDAMSPPVSHPGSPARSPFIDAAQSPRSSGNRSATMSPFSDIHAIDAQSPPSHPLAPNYARSPSPVLLSPPQSSLHLASESDFAILSPDLRSGMFSPAMSSVDENAFDFDDFSSDSGSSVGSGSDNNGSNGWTSVGRRTPSPTHYGNHFE